MGQASRTTKLEVDLARANGGKVRKLTDTVAILDEVRAVYIDLLLAHPGVFEGTTTYWSKKKGEYVTRPWNQQEIRTWIENLTIPTEAHPEVVLNLHERFPDLPIVHRRAAIYDAIGKVKGYLASHANWEQAGYPTKGKPNLPGNHAHPALYQGGCELYLEQADPSAEPVLSVSKDSGQALRDGFARLKVYDAQTKTWAWVNYPLRWSRWHAQRLDEKNWTIQSPKLVVRQGYVALHIPQVRQVKAQKVAVAKQDPNLVTVAVDLNVKHLAVITVRQHGRILETVFLSDQGLDQARCRHLKTIAFKQWQSGKAVRGEHSNVKLWAHVRRMNEQAAQRVSRRIVEICQKYPGCVLVFERLRKIKVQKGESKSRRWNRKRANHLRGKIREYAGDKAYREGIVTVETNPHGTSQYCSRCGAKGERFSQVNGQPQVCQGGRLFRCLACGYEVQADFNASVNIHHSFYSELHWQPRSPSGESRPARL